ncbi:protein BIG GRAIN 1-like E [Pistacia vera]|uniref:protein BIG GRAIN 1-like E n=1 Tax=Pistacia vera TaxID=55513 RepID=UPI001263A5AB|nr:protein BIG GRAIN 1-like E [Pistacia vera]XP_031272120.1 protein BIG GRAIN 1-like E [Pistacia vera]
MSITLSDTDKIYKKSFHHRNDSGELDVFEAARYFSGYNEGSGYHCGTFSQKILKEERQAWRAGRISLDVPMMRESLPQNPVCYQKQSHHGIEKQIKEKKYKQPSSPGGRLASFLNSLFNQSSSKKKKSKSSTQSMKDEEESPGGRRKRRSSISHFRSSSTTDSKSLYSSSSSGFRTPPPYAHTPTKSYKDLRSYSDHKHVVSLSTKHNGQALKSTALQNEVMEDKKINTDLPWLDEKLKFNNNAYSDKYKNSGNHAEKDRIWVDHRYSSEEKEFKKLNEIDDGADSDSSSDLFELQNYDLGIYSNGLPVYETTHMDSIRRGAPISNGAL